jgi:hypothetical protein
VTDGVAARVLTLPTGTGVTTDDIAVITDVIRRAVEAGPALARRLPKRHEEPIPGRAPGSATTIGV